MVGGAITVGTSISNERSANLSHDMDQCWVKQTANMPFRRWIFDAKCRSRRILAWPNFDGAELKDLGPRQWELVKNVLENHPSLSIDEALEILKEFGGL